MWPGVDNCDFQRRKMADHTARALSLERLGEVVDITLSAKQPTEAPLCPGQKYRHYAPRAKLIPSQIIDPNYKGVIVGFTDRKYPSASKVYFLGSSSDPDEIAYNLYSVFRRLDAEHVPEALVDMNIFKTDIYQTIIERIQKACY